MILNNLIIKVNENKMVDLQQKIVKFSLEIERLNMIWKDCLVEVEEWKHKFMDLESENHEHKHRAETVKRAGAQEKQYLQSEIERLREQLDMRNHEIEEWKSKNTKLEININEYRCKILNKINTI